MNNPRDPFDSFTTDPATGRNAYLLQGIAYEMMPDGRVSRSISEVQVLR